MHNVLEEPFAPLLCPPLSDKQSTCEGPAYVWESFGVHSGVAGVDV